MNERLRRVAIPILAAVIVLAALLYGGYKIFEDPSNQWFGKTVVSGPSDQRVVALTYDDGPNPPYTDRILDVLAREKVKATFFVVGRAVVAYPDTMRRIVKGGHAVGNHTWDHRHLVILPRALLHAEMQRTDDAIQKTVHVQTRFMRPPFGARDWIVLDEMRRLGYTVVMWSVPLPRDWEYPSAATIARRVTAHVKDGSIIVLHDGNRGLLCSARHLPPQVCNRAADIEATRLIVEDLKSRGFRFVTIPQLLAMHNVPKHKSAHEIE
ncbi:MAG: polysaccharide deacetylase family protein [Candidatus Eremiobacteraeota bacterium]|nr:polysaccharide deacetylase family protein [Candidatus Eremiobacteraeota bacterium]